MNTRASTPNKRLPPGLRGEGRLRSPWRIFALREHMLRDRLTIDAAEGSIVVSAPVADVYKRWLDFENYPQFITVIKQVRKLNANHFVASLAFNGKQYETTLEMMLRVPERRLAWRAIVDHSARDHLAAGVVSFVAGPDHSTCVTLK